MEPQPIDRNVVASDDPSSRQNQQPKNDETDILNSYNQALGRIVVTSDVDSRNRKPENDETKALNLYITELMKLFRRGVSMGFLVKRGDNYHWNLDDEELCHQT